VNKKFFASALCGVLAVTSLLIGCSKGTDQGKGGGKVELKSLTDRVSYMLGADIGASLRAGKTEVVTALIIRGLEDSYQGKPLLLSEAEIEKVKQEFTQKLQQDYLAKNKAAGEKNKKEGEAFQAENKKKTGVVTTASGLQYQVITEGKGANPKANAVVKVHYKGMLLDGKEFDSSYKRGEPVKVKIGEVIPGWSEALPLMKVGGKYKLVIPAALAYGEKEVGQVIGPNSTLIFEVELLGIEK